MTGVFDDVTDRFAASSREFERKLREVRHEQWSWPTPCTEWTVRDLVNHMARGNLSYARLMRGGTAAEFLRDRDADALGMDPASAFTRSVRVCADTFAGDITVDYPLGRITSRQALAVRTADSLVHTWDLARAIGADERLDAGLVDWVSDHLLQIYADLAETPIDATSTHRFFAAPGGTAADASRQEQLLHLMGRLNERK